MFADNSELCPVAVLKMYNDRTTQQAITFCNSKPVFVTSRKPFRRAKPDTIGHWIKNFLYYRSVSVYSTRCVST